MEEAFFMGFSGGFEQGKPGGGTPWTHKIHINKYRKGQSIISGSDWAGQFGLIAQN